MYFGKGGAALGDHLGVLGSSVAGTGAVEALTGSFGAGADIGAPVDEALSVATGKVVVGRFLCGRDLTLQVCVCLHQVVLVLVVVMH